MVSGLLLGGVLGLTVQLYSNAVRKLPLMRHPWEHVLWTGKFTLDVTMSSVADQCRPFLPLATA